MIAVVSWSSSQVRLFEDKWKQKSMVVNDVGVGADAKTSVSRHISGAVNCYRIRIPG
jgi:hypothetical protein